MVKIFSIIFQFVDGVLAFPYRRERKNDFNIAAASLAINPPQTSIW
jgi:cbb3-type cytochrome oxidase subunit 3